MSFVSASIVKPTVVYLDAVGACDSLMNAPPEDGNLIAETYVGVHCL
jgi:hypothetical protein